MKHVWLIEQGAYGTSDGWIEAACKTKKLAEQKCRKDRFRWITPDNLWLDGGHWRTIERIDYYE